MSQIWQNLDKIWLKSACIWCYFFLCSLMSLNHLKSLYAPILYQNLTDKARVLIFWPNVVKKLTFWSKFKNMVNFYNFGKKSPNFFSKSFFGLSIQFRYSRLKNLRSLMPLFIKYPAGKCGIPNPLMSDPFRNRTVTATSQKWEITKTSPWRTHCKHWVYFFEWEPDGTAADTRNTHIPSITLPTSKMTICSK